MIFLSVTQTSLGMEGASSCAKNHRSMGRRAWPQGRPSAARSSSTEGCSSSMKNAANGLALIASER